MHGGKGLGALGTAVVVGAAIIGATVLAEHLAGRDPLRCKEYQPTAQTGSSAPGAPMPSVRTVEPAYQTPDCARPKTEKEYELCQQRRAAYAADESACVGRWQFWIGCAGLGGLLLTIIYAAKSARAAGDAAAEMARQIKVQIRIEQPHVRIGAMAARIDPEVDWRDVVLTVHNIGKTAAVMIEWVTLCEVTDELPAEPVYHDARKIRGRILRPDDPAGWEVVVFLSEADTVAVYHGQETVYLWGYFRYEDQFGQTRKSGFGYKGNPMGDEPGRYIGVIWSRAGGNAYNYDRDEPAET